MPVAWIAGVGDDGFEAYLTRWRAAAAQRAVAWLFLRHDERVRYGALAALEREWRSAAHDVSEPQVAAAKLGWWREELQHALEGQARHPLTQRLFADARVREIPLPLWTAPVEATIASLFEPPPVDFTTQRQSVAPLAEALATLETHVWFGKGASGRAAAAVAVGELVADLRALEAEIAHGRTPLPMNLLARHGLTIDAMATDAPARRAALRDHVADLRRELSGAATMAGPLTLFRAADLQQDLTALARAARADDPLVALRAPVHGVAAVLKTWRAARNWRATARGESRP